MSFAVSGIAPHGHGVDRQQEVPPGSTRDGAAPSLGDFPEALFGQAPGPGSSSALAGVGQSSALTVSPRRTRSRTAIMSTPERRSVDVEPDFDAHGEREDDTMLLGEEEPAGTRDAPADSIGPAEAGDGPADQGPTEVRNADEPLPSASSQRGIKRSSDALKEEEEADSCIVCFEPYTSSGEHRLVSLKCGHIFGESCALKCIAEKKRCPQCNGDAKKNDVRVIYAQTIRVIDNAEEDRLRRELDKAQQLARERALECEKVKLQVAQFQTRMAQLEKEKSMWIANGGVPVVDSTDGLTTASSVRVHWKCRIQINNSNTCRVMSYCAMRRMCVVATSATTGLFNFARFGVRRVNFDELSSEHIRTGDFVGLHTKEIRDMAFNPMTESFLMTASQDQTAKFIDLRSNRITTTVNLDKPAWACCWNGANSQHQFFVGLQSGKLKLYDIRNAAETLEEVNDKIGAGIVSLSYVKPDTSNAAFPSGGVLAGRLKSCEFYTPSPVEGQGHVEHVLIPSGTAAFNSISFEPKTRHLLVSTRGSETENAVHTVHQISSQMVEDARVYSTNEVTSIQGALDPPRFARTHLVSHPFDSRACMVVGDFNGKMAALWDAGTGRSFERIQTERPLLDSCSMRIADTDFVALLMESQVRVYRLEHKP